MARTKPLILTSAFTGARYSPWKIDPVTGWRKPVEPGFKAPFMPIGRQEIRLDAIGAWREGARFMHIHARNPNTGAQFADLQYYKDITEHIRSDCPGAILSYPTSRKGEVEIQIRKTILRHFERARAMPSDEKLAEIEADIRGVAVKAKPDTLTTFTVPEMKMFGTPKRAAGFEDVPGWTDPAIMKLYYDMMIERTREYGVAQEIEVTTLGQFQVMPHLMDHGLEGPIHMVLLPGFSAGFPVMRKAYEMALSQVEKFRGYTGLHTTVSCGAVILPKDSKETPGEKYGHDYREVFNWVAEDDRVDAFRTGLEDTPLLYDVPQTNERLVKHARCLAEDAGIRIETDPAAVRRQFHLPAPKMRHYAYG